MGTALSSFSSEVLIGEDCFVHLNTLLQIEFSSSKIFILVDNSTKDYCLPKLVSSLDTSTKFELIEIDGGEGSKNIYTCIEIWKTLSEKGVDKNSLLISLGGGVIGDLGGFTASTILRGIKHIQIPTTLLAMVDSSAGGKTGFNFAGLKNQVGTFSHSRAICIYPAFARTLPERIFNSGLAEIAKHAIIADKSLWNEFRNTDDYSLMDLSYWIKRSVEIKNSFVVVDVNDKNERHALNFGHTIGHALEAYSLQNGIEPVLHGEAVAFGMITEAYLSVEKLGLDPDHAKEISDCLSGLFRNVNAIFNAKDLLQYIKSDKKNINNIPNFSLIPNIGEVQVNQIVEQAQILEAILKAQKYFLDS